MATQQNVVYYDGVPYIDSSPQQKPQRFGSPLSGSAIGNSGGMESLLNRLKPSLDFDAKVSRGWLTPIQQKTPPAPTRPPPELSKVPEAGWGAPQGGGGGLDAILNGTAPMFAAAPQVGQIPQGTQTASAMPNPKVPQQNFDALGKNLMAQILNPGGM